MKIRNADDLKKYLALIVESANKEVAKSVISDLKESIDKNVYNAYSPEEYQRTYALRESVDVIRSVFSGSTNIVTVGHDDRRLSYNSIIGQTVDSRGVPDIIIKGQAGAVTEKGYWRNSSNMKAGHSFAFPRDYITPVKIGLLNEYGTLFKKALRNQTGNKVI